MFAGLHRSGAYTHFMKCRTCGKVETIPDIQAIFFYLEKLTNSIEFIIPAYSLLIDFTCSKYDLCSKSKVPVHVDKVKPHYLRLIGKGPESRIRVDCLVDPKIQRQEMVGLIKSRQQQSIQLGINDVDVSGGTESMSNAPKYLAHSRKGSRLGHDTVFYGMIEDGLCDVYNDFVMGCAQSYVQIKLVVVLMLLERGVQFSLLIIIVLLRLMIQRVPKQMLNQVVQGADDLQCYMCLYVRHEHQICFCLNGVRSAAISLRKQKVDNILHSYLIVL